MSLDEFQIITRYFTRPVKDPDVLLGIGDDAAVVSAGEPVAVAVDTLVAGVHFPEHLSGDAVGYRSLAVNLSDLAAMGARPRWGTLALTLPHADAPWLEAFAASFFGLADTFGVSLVGGDLTRGPLTVTVQLLGTVSRERLLTRGGGRAGDDVYVTGCLGDAAAGLAVLGGETQTSGTGGEALEERFLRPTARVAEGGVLGGLASAAIDISDGLLADLGHLCTASGCGAVVDVELLPLSAELLSMFPRSAEAYALHGGDDYELCFTASPDRAGEVHGVLEPLGVGARRIGGLTAEPGVLCRRAGEPFVPDARGYEHFPHG